MKNLLLEEKLKPKWLFGINFKLREDHQSGLKCIDKISEYVTFTIIKWVKLLRTFYSFCTSIIEWILWLKTRIQGTIFKNSYLIYRELEMRPIILGQPSHHPVYDILGQVRWCLLNFQSVQTGKSEKQISDGPSTKYI